MAMCRGNYQSTNEKITVYGFSLSDKDELRRWLSALPNVIDESKVSRNMGVCSLYWPSDAVFKSCFGKLIPSEPPILLNCPLSFFRQTCSTSSMSTHRFPSEYRSTIPDELEAFGEKDKLPNDFDVVCKEVLIRNFSGLHVVRDCSFSSFF